MDGETGSERTARALPVFLETHNFQDREIAMMFGGIVGGASERASRKWASIWWLFQLLGSNRRPSDSAERWISARSDLEIDLMPSFSLCAPCISPDVDGGNSENGISREPVYGSASVELFSLSSHCAISKPKSKRHFYRTMRSAWAFNWQFSIREPIWITIKCAICLRGVEGTNLRKKNDLWATKLCGTEWFNGAIAQAVYYR